MSEPTQGRGDAFLTRDATLEHWLGHRALTRRVIEVFPEHELFTFTAGGMRTFAAMAIEMTQMIAPTMKGVLEDVWEPGGFGAPGPTTKAGVLEAWDDAVETLQEAWPKIPADRFHEVEDAFGLWRAPIWATLQYLIDNEIHHRGQGYVYLRMLEVEPPPFYERPPMGPPTR